MSKGSVCAYLTAVLLLSVDAGPALAADFTFKIPVGLYNLRPAITAGKVVCRVWDRFNTIETKLGTTPKLIGVGESESFAITKGTYEGSLLAQFNAGTGMNPINGSDWACWLWLYDATIGTGKRVDADRVMATAYNRTKPYKIGDQGYLR
jgi:hypothetical protein